MYEDRSVSSLSGWMFSASYRVEVTTEKWHTVRILPLKRAEAALKSVQCGLLLN